MLAACRGPAVGSCCDARALLRDAGPGPGPAWGGLRVRDAATLGLFGEEKAGRRKKGRRGGGGSSRLVAAWNGPVLSFYNSRLGLDSQKLLPAGQIWLIFQSQDSSQMLRIGPLPGNISEVEAYCRIFRAAEQLHTIIMKTVCNPETGECTVSYNIPSENLPQLEEKVVTMLGCMLALLDRGREEVLSGRSSVANSFKASDVGFMDGKLPPLAVFRSDMKKCCESLYIALANYLTPDDRSVDIWRKMQRLRNVCYDAGFPRSEGHPSPMLFANWTPVCYSTQKEDEASEDFEVDFWKGGQVTDEGLEWLISNGYKTIVDLRDEVVKDEYYQTALDEAVSCGNIEVIALPVEVGTAPSMDQVQQFASVVSDPRRKPVYLHSQEGVTRTAAMVSRWKQYISRHAAQSSPKSKFNGISKTASEAPDQIGSQSSGSSVQYPSYKDDIALKELDRNGTTDFTGGNNENKGANIPEKLPSQDMDTLALEVETPSIPAMELSPLEAQFPSGDIFSRRDLENFYRGRKATSKYLEKAKVETTDKLTTEMSPFKSQCPSGDVFSRRNMEKFFKDRKITPQTFLNFEKNRIGKRRPIRGRQETLAQSGETQISSQISKMKKHVQETSIATESLVRLTTNNGGNFNDAVHEIEMSGTTSPATFSISAAVNMPGVSIAANYSPNHSNNGSVRADENDIDSINGNMCASSTGVVRIQSRRKAEMFLVRTDGFSCTREKVTESSLAFTHPSTQQQMLMWKSSPKTVLLLKKLGNELIEETKEVAAFLHHQEKMNVLVEPDVHDTLARIPGFGFVQTFYIHDTSDLHERVDFVACLGGDGVILHASNMFRGAVPPVVSFNLGSLGFLTSHTFEDYREDLRAVIHGNNTLDGVYITLRMRLRCEIFRNGAAIPGKVFDILNEVVVDRGSSPYISKIECYEQNRLITKVQGDGVIVATPTGSTAYSTSAGGSMVHPNVPCILFTPICPHSLSFRPVILPDSARLELRIPPDARSNAWVSFDGKRRQQLSRGDSVRICMSEHPLPTVNKSDQTGDWFRSLVRCLNWNERQEQRALLSND